MSSLLIPFEKYTYFDIAGQKVENWQVMKSLKEALQSGDQMVADGAMATSLYERGFYINRSFEELSLTQPEAVREVVRGFLRAGAQIIHTNTFSATKPKLQQYGLQDQMAEILKASAQIAKSEAKDQAYVIGAIGPLGVMVEPLGPTSIEEAENDYAESALALHQGGVDGFALNAIHDFNELEAGIRAVRKVSSRPLIVNIGLQENFKTAHGHTLAQLAELAMKYDLDAIGICGEIGPSTMLTAIEQLRALTEKTIVALPNAGLPRYVNDQYIYLCNPDYLGKYAKRFAKAGASVIGGHSGVYESHIKAIYNSLRMVHNGDGDITAYTRREIIHPIVDEPQTPQPLESRSLWGKKLKNGELVVSVELVPPALTDISKFEARCAELVNGGVEFVNIPDGARAMARVSSLHLATHVARKFKLEPIPHFTCRDRNLIGLQSDLLGAHIGGVRNILLVTGDPPKLGNNPGASAVYDVDAIGLTHIVSRMNHGLNVGGASAGSRTDFVIGVALNPTASNLELEIRRFKYKVEAGAEYAITQPIYNLESYKRFLDLAGDIKIPIVMGVWPLVSLRNAEFLKNEVPGVDVPDWVIGEMQKANSSKEDAIKRGLEIAHRTMSEAKSMVAGFQVSAPFNKAEIALDAIQVL